VLYNARLPSQLLLLLVLKKNTESGMKQVMEQIGCEKTADFPKHLL
jgi:hypothetical protein